MAQPTQPGGTDPHMSEGPLRPGLVPKRIWFPFVKPAFYVNQLQQVSRRTSQQLRSRLEVAVKQKRIILAGGDGVFSRFRRNK